MHSSIIRLLRRTAALGALPAVFALHCDSGGGGDDDLTNLLLLAAVVQSQQPNSTCQGVISRYGITASSSLVTDLKGNYVPGEALVRFADGVSRTEAHGLVRSLAGPEAGLQSLMGKPARTGALPGSEGAEQPGADASQPGNEAAGDEAGLQIVSLGATSVESALASFRKDPNVVSAQPNYVYRALDTTPNDGSFGNLWGLNNTGQFNTDPNSNTQNDTCVAGVNCYDMDAPQAWDTIHDCGTVVVAVLDSGTNYNQEDLSSNMWSSPAGETGCDFIDADTDAQDKNRHGTHVAGTIGASGNNGTGITGVCWKVQIMPVRVLGSTGGGTTAQLIAGIDYATENGADIINLSLGSSSGSDNDEVFKALDRARSAGVLVIAAAGNSAADNDTTNTFPANYSLDNIISVAALSQDGTLAGFSNFGDQSVDIGAPGVSVFSSYPGAYTKVTDDFSGGIGSWTSSGNAGSWAVRNVGGSAGNALEDPGGSGSYGNSWNTTAYRSYNFINGDVVTFKFFTAFSVEGGASSCFDTFKPVTSASGGVPSSSLATLCGNTPSGSLIGLEYELTDAPGVSSYSAGFNLTTDSSVTAGGVIVDNIEGEYLKYNASTYEYLDGTSMAAPHVAGLAALLKARQPACGYAQIRDAILNGAATGGDSSKIASGRQAKIPGALTQIDAAACN